MKKMHRGMQCCSVVLRMPVFSDTLLDICSVRYAHLMFAKLGHSFACSTSTSSLSAPSPHCRWCSRPSWLSLHQPAAPRACRGPREPLEALAAPPRASGACRGPREPLEGFRRGPALGRSTPCRLRASSWLGQRQRRQQLMLASRATPRRLHTVRFINPPVFAKHTLIRRAPIAAHDEAA